MPQLPSIVVLALILVMGFQMAACLASGDCFQFHTGRGAISADLAYDCDGCGCCHLHFGFRLAPPVRPSAPIEFLQQRQEPAVCAQARSVSHRPPRS